MTRILKKQELFSGILDSEQLNAEYSVSIFEWTLQPESELLQC